MAVSHDMQQDERIRPLVSETQTQDPLFCHVHVHVAAGGTGGGKGLLVLAGVFLFHDIAPSLAGNVKRRRLTSERDVDGRHVAR